MLLDDDDFGSGQLKYLIMDDITLSNTELMASIRIENLTYDDNGMYTCQARNFLFESRRVNSSNSVVDIHCKPIICFD